MIISVCTDAPNEGHCWKRPKNEFTFLYKVNLQELSFQKVWAKNILIESGYMKMFRSRWWLCRHKVISYYQNRLAYFEVILHTLLRWVVLRLFFSFQKRYPVMTSDCIDWWSTWVTSLQPISLRMDANLYCRSLTTNAVQLIEYLSWRKKISCCFVQTI